MILRDYQIRAVRDGLRFFRNDKLKYNSLMVLPTGSGKSLVIANIAKELNQPTIVFQPTKEILEQNHAKLMAYGYNASIYSASFNSKRISNLTFATIGSVRTKPELFQHFKNIIIDECHFVNAKKGMYSDFLKVVRGKVLGLTATPYRLVTDGFGGSILKFQTRTRPRVFNRVIHVTQNGDLFNRGYLADLDYRTVNGFDSRQIKINSTGADYDDNSVRRYYKEVGFIDNLKNVVKETLQLGRRNILVFTRFIEESQLLVDELGDCAEIVTGETPKKERAAIIKRFRDGVTKVVANVGVLTTGFDFPELETIIIARPTMSLALYYQMIGRGIRIHPGKESSWIIDLCDNYKKFGKVEDLTIVDPKKGLWHISSHGKQLTNVYFGQPYNRGA